MVIAILAGLALCAFDAGALASTESIDDIEGVWSFNGGAVAVTMLPDGNFQGTVVRPTKFAACEHPVGQVVWNDMRLQADGSYWGMHRWYLGKRCEAIAKLGLTAWRVLVESNGSPTLRVCFSKPSGGSQPTIARDGTGAHYTYGCQSLALVAPVPTTADREVAEETAGRSTVISFPSVVILPLPKACISQRSLKIKLNNPAFDPLKELVVKVANKKVIYLRGVKSIRKGVILTQLPSGSFKVSVLASTVLKQQLSGSQTYTSCAAGSGRIKLKPR